jgi:hypothetical protein
VHEFRLVPLRLFGMFLLFFTSRASKGKRHRAQAGLGDLGAT